MSPFKRKKLNLIRKRLDKLDNSLIGIIKKRTLLVKEVLKQMGKQMQLLRVNQIQYFLELNLLDPLYQLINALMQKNEQKHVNFQKCK